MNFSRRTLSLMAIDLLSFICSGLLSLFMIRTTVAITSVMYALIIFTAVLNVAGMWVFGTYRTIWRYATLVEFSKCFAGIVAGTAVSVIISLALNSFEDIFYYLLFFISICAVTATRTVYRYFIVVNSHENMDNRKRAMIVGGGDTGRRIIQEMSDPQCQYKAVVIADDDPSKLFREVLGVKVAGRTEDIPQMVKEYNIERIIVAMPSCTKEEQKKVVNICSKTNCKVKVLPYLHELTIESSLLKQTREINIADLLGRDEIHFDEMRNFRLIEGNVCMVTGGGG